MSEFDEVVVDVDALSDLFGLTDRRIQQLAETGIIERRERGDYLLGPCVRGYVDFLQERVRRRADADESADRARLTAAKADLAEIEAAERKRELIPYSSVRDMDFRMARVLRNNLQSMPDRIASLVAAESDAAVVHGMILGEVNNSLERVLDALSAEHVDDADLDITRVLSRAALEDNTGDESA